jgi:hypothetical protein
MFNDSRIPLNEIMTRYIAPFGLTALLRPSKPGQSVDSFWIGSQGDSESYYSSRPWMRRFIACVRSLSGKNGIDVF